MLSLPDRASVERAITAADDRLAGLLATRLALSIATKVVDLTHYVIIEPGDRERDIVEGVHFSPLVNPIDCARFGEPTFHPWWDWLADLGGWYEMIVTVGDSGFAYVLLIEDAPGADATLIQLCRRFAEVPTCK